MGVQTCKFMGLHSRNILQNTIGGNCLTAKSERQKRVTVTATATHLYRTWTLYILRRSGNNHNVVTFSTAENEK